jgi:CheY-like chemotaxis protein
MKILYLEDNSTDADLTRRSLEHFDSKFDLDIVGTLAAAFAKIEAFESVLAENGPPLYHLALLDMH